MVYQPLVYGSYALQTEGHNPIAIEPLAGDEGSLLLIFLSQLYLVVPEEGVHKGEELVSSC